MATKKPLNKTPHFHIPADPQRVRSEEITARHHARKEEAQLAAKGLKDSGVTLDTLYEMLSDMLERQEILENRLKQISINESRG
ncbi:hypothetical protein DFP94_11291 [Fontibacillus phaseoli]|uniref:Uncharacterized protein n=1 Tax=Fontibacillus phaseoli TaxID=1416533 RepID=A0A369B4W3_9BACL|nr:hypothetical protein [Fontibacillus phaseoli]RCX16471.1 hypothetical protein DFP94_11291 [Fontibacillus phaseoli]